MFGMGIKYNPDEIVGFPTYKLVFSLRKTDVK